MTESNPKWHKPKLIVLVRGGMGRGFYMGVKLMKDQLWGYRINFGSVVMMVLIIRLISFANWIVRPNMS